MMYKRRSPLVPAGEVAVRGLMPPRVDGRGYVPPVSIGTGELMLLRSGAGG